jgi:WD40 repeat protein
VGIGVGIAIIAAALTGAWLASDAKESAPPTAEIEPTLPMRTLRGHQGAVHSVAFHPDGARLLSASGDHTIGLWDLATGRLLARLEGHTDSVRSVVCLSDGETIISSSDDLTIRIWDLAARKTKQTLRGHTAKVRKLALMPDEASLISVSKDGSLRVWDLPSGAQRLERTEHDDWVGGNRGYLSVAIRPDGEALATAAFDRTVRLWDTKDFGVSRRLGPHASDVGIVSYSSDGRYLLYDLEAGQLRVMSADGREDVMRLVGHEDWVYSIAACPGRPIAATGSEDTLIMVWDIPSGERLATLAGHDYTVGALAFSTDGKLLASGAGDETVRLWDVSSLTGASSD